MDRSPSPWPAARAVPPVTFRPFRPSRLRRIHMPIVSSGALMDDLRRYGLLSPEHLSELPHLFRGRCHHAQPLAKLLGQRGWLTIFQINEILAGNAKNLVVGPYRVLERLGQGGVSQVFKARHAEDGSVVA